MLELPLIFGTVLLEDPPLLVLFVVWIECMLLCFVPVPVFPSGLATFFLFFLFVLISSAVEFSEAVELFTDKEGADVDVFWFFLFRTRLDDSAGVTFRFLPLFRRPRTPLVSAFVETPAWGVEISAYDPDSSNTT